MLNRRLLIIVVLIGVVISIVVAGFLIFRPVEQEIEGPQTGPVITPEPGQPQETEQIIQPDNPHEEDHSDAFIQNSDPLFDYFSDVQALFINDAVINYASDTFNATQIYITDGYIKDNHDGTYGFDVNDGEKSLFYVIATKQPKDNVKVDFY